MIAYLTTILLSFVLAFLFCLVAGASKHWRRFLGLILFAILFTVSSFNLTNNPSAFDSAYGDSLIRDNASLNKADKENAGTFFRENFIFIDNNYDKVLIRPEDPEAGTNALTPVTNRRSLTGFLDWCITHANDIDLIICDIGFSQTDSSARTLLPLFRQLDKAGKLILSNNGDSLSIVRQFPASSALVTAESSNDRFNVQALLGADGMGMAYAIYQKMDTVSTDKPNAIGLFSEIRKATGQHWCLRTFPPIMYLNDELTFLNDNDSLRSQFPGISIHRPGNYFQLNDHATDEIVTLLQEHKAKGSKNILFLGTFKGPDDMHNTIFGKFHGSAILLNTLYNLHIGNHIVGLGLILILFTGYMLIGFLISFGVLIANGNDQNAYPANLWKFERKWKYRFTNWHKNRSEKTRHKLAQVFEVLLEFFFLFVLAIMVCAAYWFCGLYINIIGLSVMLLLFRTFLIFFYKII